jgi:hypothetical protein
MPERAGECSNCNGSGIVHIAGPRMAATGPCPLCPAGAALSGHDLSAPDDIDRSAAVGPGA